MTSPSRSFPWRFVNFRVCVSQKSYPIYKVYMGLIIKLLRVPSQGYHHFPYEKNHGQINFYSKLRWEIPRIHRIDMNKIYSHRIPMGRWDVSTHMNGVDFYGSHVAEINPMGCIFLFRKGHCSTRLQICPLYIFGNKQSHRWYRARSKYW